MRKLPHTKSCFVCGESNPIGLHLIMETDGRIVRAHFQPRPEHVGFKHTVHGGLITTLLDELMVWACAVQTQQFAYCAELNVRFLRPVTPGQNTTVTSELVSNRRNKLFEARAELRDEANLVLAEGSGKYMPMKGEGVAQLREELIGDVSMFVRGS